MHQQQLEALAASRYVIDSMGVIAADERMSMEVRAAAGAEYGRLFLNYLRIKTKLAARPVVDDDERE